MDGVAQLRCHAQRQLLRTARDYAFLGASCGSYEHFEVVALGDVPGPEQGGNLVGLGPDDRTCEERHHRAGALGLRVVRGPLGQGCRIEIRSAGRRPRRCCADVTGHVVHQAVDLADLDLVGVGDLRMAVDEFDAASA